MHLLFLPQYGSHLYCCAFLAPDPLRQGKLSVHLPLVLQYASCLCGNTPPICTAMLLRKYWWLGKFLNTANVMLCQFLARTFAKHYMIEDCARKSQCCKDIQHEPSMNILPEVFFACRQPGQSFGLGALFFPSFAQSLYVFRVHNLAVQGG